MGSTYTKITTFDNGDLDLPADEIYGGTFQCPICRKLPKYKVITLDNEEGIYYQCAHFCKDAWSRPVTFFDRKSDIQKLAHRWTIYIRRFYDEKFDEMNKQLGYDKIIEDIDDQFKEIEPTLYRDKYIKLLAKRIVDEVRNEKQ